jgi:hypothetical protein
VDIDAAICKNAPISIDVADLGVGCDDSFESFGRVICSQARHSISRFPQNWHNPCEAVARRATFFYT